MIYGIAIYNKSILLFRYNNLRDYVLSTRLYRQKVVFVVAEVFLVQEEKVVEEEVDNEPVDATR